MVTGGPAQPRGGSLHMEHVAVTWGWPALLTARAVEHFLASAEMPPEWRVELVKVAERHRRAGLAWVEGEAMSEVGHADTRPADIPSSSAGDVSVDEAAALLGVGVRQARRICGSLPSGRKVGGVWVADRDEVVAERRRRDAAA